MKKPTYAQLETRIKELERTINGLQKGKGPGGKALQDREYRYRSLFDNNRSIMLVIDPKTLTIVDANPEAIRFYGWDKHELIGKKMTEINTLSEEKIREKMEKIKECHSHHFYFSHRLANGQIRDIEGVGGRSAIDGKELWYSIVHDITDRKKAETKLKNYNAQLEKMVKERTSSLEDLNTALKVLLQKRDDDKKEMEKKIFANYKSMISPFLQRLKKSLTKKEEQHLLEIIDSNLKEVLLPFSQILSDPMINLTPTEIQIASFIKQGFSTKDIAKFMNNSVRTIDAHRDRIRKKLNIKNKKINLRAFLLNLETPNFNR